MPQRLLALFLTTNSIPFVCSKKDKLRLSERKREKEREEGKREGEKEDR